MGDIGDFDPGGLELVANAVGFGKVLGFLRVGSELNLLKEWTAVKTEEFGKFQYLDFSVTSNRTDVPLQACIDYLVTNIEIDY